MFRRYRLTRTYVSRKGDMSWYHMVRGRLARTYVSRGGDMGLDGLVQLYRTFPEDFYRGRRRRIHFDFHNTLKIINVMFVYGVWIKG